MDDEFVMVGYLHDPLRAQMLKALLEEEGVPVLLPGIEHRGMLGAAGAFIEIPVMVPRRHAEDTLELLEAMEEAESEPSEVDAWVPEELVTRGDPYRDAPVENDFGKRRLRKRFAALSAALFGFGIGHTYAGDRRGGLLLAVAEAWAWVMVCFGSAPMVAVIAVARALDAYGSCRRVELANGDRAPDRVDRASEWVPVLVPTTVAVLFVLFFLSRLES